MITCLSLNVYNVLKGKGNLSLFSSWLEYWMSWQWRQRRWLLRLRCWRELMWRKNWRCFCHDLLWLYLGEAIDLMLRCLIHLSRIVMLVKVLLVLREETVHHRVLLVIKYGRNGSSCRRLDKLVIRIKAHLWTTLAVFGETTEYEDQTPAYQGHCKESHHEDQ